MGRHPTNSYGKTVEQLDGVEYVLANECPVEYSPFVVSDDEHSDLPIWVKKSEPAVKDYHKPQIGSFITAHVRMKVRVAALLDAEAWLYADTDCCMFSREPVGLDIHKSRYGAWKVECEGDHYRVVTKKVYAKIYDEQTKRFDELTRAEQLEFRKKYKNEQHAKGVNIKKLTSADFEAWSRGEVPIQKQLHKNNLMKVLGGADMYIEQIRRGTKIKVDK